MFIACATKGNKPCGVDGIVACVLTNLCLPCSNWLEETSENHVAKLIRQLVLSQNCCWCLRPLVLLIFIFTVILKIKSWLFTCD